MRPTHLQQDIRKGHQTLKAIKKYRFFILILFLLTGLVLTASLVIDEKRSQNQKEMKPKTHLADNEAAYSIKESTVLFLLCIGMIGLLGIRRYKNNNTQPESHSKLQEENYPNEAESNQRPMF
jgi:hypothetical protein